MSNFWVSPTGEKITGDAKAAFLPSFSVIPEGTTAIATIKSCAIIKKEATQYADADRFIEVVYKLLDGDFKDREVTQKIKVFSGKPESISRNLNMLKLVMDLCGFKPTHSNEPTNDELATLCNKIVGIKIGEWSMPKQDGGMMEGNHVREVSQAAGFVCETGIKAEVKRTPSAVDSAFSRNPSSIELDLDIPF